MNPALRSARPGFASKQSGAVARTAELDSRLDGEKDFAATALSRTRPTAASAKICRCRTTVINRALILKRAFETGAELELAIAAVKFIVMNRDAVVEPQRPDRQVQAHANAPVVVKI